MKFVQLMAAGLVVSLIGASVRADEKSDHAKLIVGKWEVTKADEGTLPVGAVVEFTKDGKIKVTAKMGDQEEKHEGTYKVDADAFTFNFKIGDQEVSEKITIKKLTKDEFQTTNK